MQWEEEKCPGNVGVKASSLRMDSTAPSSPFPHRIHLMAGRVPKGADRATVRGEMETVFLENLRHAAEVLAQVRQLKGLPRCHSG